MKSLRARVTASQSMRTGAAITMLWAAALGQATPDEQNIPEPSVLPLLLAGVVVMLLLRRKK
jgi:hypothetical protein